MSKSPLGIYLHIPFCVRKCLYCDFLSAPASADRIESYVNLLLREMQAASDNGQLQGYEAETVFFGGGTPSLLSASQIERILCKLSSLIPVRADAEITLEMNPGTVTRETLAEIKSLGVNRISIGVQSFQDHELALLGRIHSAAEVYRLWEWTEQLSFSNRNIDLMSGIPGQTEESFRDTLDRAAALMPEHISAYSLIVEEGTPFSRMYPDGAVDEETDRRLYALTKTQLKEHGYARYEISNYARDGYACRHNLTYWTRGDYLGFGLGAASLMNEVRFRNADTMAAYERDAAARENDVVGAACLPRETEAGDGGTDGTQARERGTDRTDAGEAPHERGTDGAQAHGCGQSGSLPPAYAEWEPLTVKDRMAETMFLGLRLTKGVSEQAFLERFGRSVYEVYGSVLDKHKRDGLLAYRDGFWSLTERGLDVSNYVMADFLL
ncbi:MAG: radical SAM family heme chaperone HemW [Clostridium sp.]|nr:radical SAM family heme chaperone HemW [Clostridium sp.]